SEIVLQKRTFLQQKITSAKLRSCVLRKPVAIFADYATGFCNMTLAHYCSRERYSAMRVFHLDKRS
ncbi:hypothetical protein, partial [Candidatus Bealeia paramacronuclearis]|uniref:hypothetical protein n=1 Tax=Candidatus Bealeia paramacronuclearis TaxID=1921001 RepID=UPI002F26595B